MIVWRIRLGEIPRGKRPWIHHFYLSKQWADCNNRSSDLPEQTEKRRPSPETMAKSKKKAETIFLVCEETGDYNYSLKRKPGGEKLRVKKYCPRLRKHTFHTEKKK